MNDPMSEHARGSKPAGELLNEALIGLRARESRLLAFEAELKEVRRAIGVIERAMGGGSSERSAPRNGTAPDAREQKRAKILAVLREAEETLSVREIAEATGSAVMGLDRMLAAMARAGEIATYAAGRYGAKARKSGEPDEQDESLEASILDAAGIEPGEG